MSVLISGKRTHTFLQCSELVEKERDDDWRVCVFTGKIQAEYIWVVLLTVCVLAVCVVYLCVVLSMVSVYQLNKCLLRQGATTNKRWRGPRQHNGASDVCVCVCVPLYIHMFIYADIPYRLNTSPMCIRSLTSFQPKYFISLWFYAHF